MSKTGKGGFQEGEGRVEKTGNLETRAGLKRKGVRLKPQVHPGRRMASLSYKMILRKASATCKEGREERRGGRRWGREISQSQVGGEKSQFPEEPGEVTRVTAGDLCSTSLRGRWEYLPSLA